MTINLYYIILTSAEYSPLWLASHCWCTWEPLECKARVWPSWLFVHRVPAAWPGQSVGYYMQGRTGSRKCQLWIPTLILGERWPSGSCSDSRCWQERFLKIFFPLAPCSTAQRNDYLREVGGGEVGERWSGHTDLEVVELSDGDLRLWTVVLSKIRQRRRNIAWHPLWAESLKRGDKNELIYKTDSQT